MFRLWGRIWKDNHMLKDTVICDDRQETRTHKVFHCLEQICYELDLGNPIWLDTTVRDFKKHSKARFYQDNFIEQIDFDYSNCLCYHLMLHFLGHKLFYMVLVIG